VASWHQLQSDFVGKVIVPAMALAVTIGLAVWKYRYELRQKQRDIRLAHITAQINELYAPLDALVEVSKVTRDLFFDKNPPELWNRKDQEIIGTPKEAWIAWIRRQLGETAQPIYDLIKAKRYLYFGDGIPEAFVAFNKHFLQYRELLSKWEQGDTSELFSTVEYPEFLLRTHVKESLSALLEMQHNLLGNPIERRTEASTKQETSAETLWDTESPP